MLTFSHEAGSEILIGVFPHEYSDANSWAIEGSGRHIIKSIMRAASTLLDRVSLSEL